MHARVLAWIMAGPPITLPIFLLLLCATWLTMPPSCFLFNVNGLSVSWNWSIIFRLWLQKKPNFQGGCEKAYYSGMVAKKPTIPVAGCKKSLLFRVTWTKSACCTVPRRWHKKWRHIAYPRWLTWTQWTMPASGLMFLVLILTMSSSCHAHVVTEQSRHITYPMWWLKNVSIFASRRRPEKCLIISLFLMRWWSERCLDLPTVPRVDLNNAGILPVVPGFNLNNASILPTAHVLTWTMPASCLLFHMVTAQRRHLRYLG